LFKDPISFSFKEQDIKGIFLVLLLLLLGGVLVDSATFGTRLAPYASKEFIYIGVSLAVLCAALYIPYTVWIEYGYVLYALAIISLAILPLIGKSVAGSKSWFSVGPLGFQPSEIAKVFTVLALASYIRDEDTHEFTLRDFSILSGIILLPFFLTMMQPDFGTAVTFLPLFLAVLFFSQLKLKELLKWGGIMAAVMALLFGFAWLTFFKDYQKERVLTFINPARSPQGAGYQVNQAKIAVGSGKFTGKGLHAGTQNRLNFLPAPHTDFIFAVAAEELGFVGSSAILLLFLLLLLRFLHTVETAKTREGSFVAMAAFFIFLMHIIINIGMVMGLFPTMGIPLPFLSYGGSFLISVTLLSGLVINVRADRF
jgi:rod shape determining protein RodA